VRTIVDFPPSYPLVNRFVAEIALPSALSAAEADESLDPELVPLIDYRNTDFFVRLKTGATYLFVACTPDFAADHMARERENAYIETGLVLVREMTIDCLLAAIEACLFIGEVDRFGVRQQDIEGAYGDEGEGSPHAKGDSVDRG
jgi:hypothetical protein